MPSFIDFPWIVLIWLSKRRTVNGIEVCVAASPEEAEEVFDKTASALLLIGRYDLLAIEQIRRDVRRLLFTDAQGGHYLAGIDTCRIGVTYARRVPPLELAMMIVHEATHARLAKQGAVYRGEERLRIERLCVEAEITFAELVPGGENAIEKTRALLKTEWWDAEKNAGDTVRDLKERGIPDWLARRIVAWSLKKSQAR